MLLAQLDKFFMQYWLYRWLTGGMFVRLHNQRWYAADSHQMGDDQVYQVYDAHGSFVVVSSSTPFSSITMIEVH